MGPQLQRGVADVVRRMKGVHQTPAIAAGVTDHVWKVEEILSLMDPTKPIHP